jgi:hypothetical protein
MTEQMPPARQPNVTPSVPGPSPPPPAAAGQSGPANAAGARDAAPPRPRPPRRGGRRKLVTPVALALLGIALLLATVVVWPDDNQPATPSSIYMVIDTSLPINLIKYDVMVLGPDRYQIGLLLQAPSVSSNSVANVSIYLPRGWQFGSCTRIGFSSCRRSPIASQQGYYPGSTGDWVMRVAGVSLLRVGYLDINIRGASFGYATNGLQESVAMPQIQFDSNVNCELAVVYQGLPDPQKYDWSGFPTDELTSGYASWIEQVTNGVEPGRVAVGIDHTAQSRDDLATFLAGALVGLAGAALIGAVQESLRLWAEGRDPQRAE